MSEKSQHRADDEDLDELEPIEAFGPDPNAQIGVMVILKDDVLDVLQVVATDRGITVVEAAQRLIEEGVELRRARDRAAAAAAAASPAGPSRIA
jgi:hypothetical protein